MARANIYASSNRAGQGPPGPPGPAGPPGAGITLLSGPTAHEWVSYIDTSGTQQLAQPAYSDISGTPALATVAISGAFADLTGKPVLAASDAGLTHHFLTAYNAATGAFSDAQPAFADISGVIAGGQLPAVIDCGSF